MRGLRKKLDRSRGRVASYRRPMRRPTRVTTFGPPSTEDLTVNTLLTEAGLNLLTEAGLYLRTES